MAFLRRALAGIVLLALTLALVAQAGRTVWLVVQARLSAQPPPFQQNERVPTVDVVRWTETDIAPELDIFGEILAARSFPLRAAVSGTVVELAPTFADGGQVKTGDLLLRIDPAEAQAALARVQADLALAEAERRDAERALAINRDELAAAERQQGFREQALARQRDLGAQGLGTAPDLETAELAAAQAEQAVLSARAAIAAAEARIDSVTVRIERARIDLAEAERTLADTVLRAPFDGTLSGVSLVEGERVAAGETLGEVIDGTALDVGFRLSTAQHAALVASAGTLIGLPLRAELSVAGLSVQTRGSITREAPRVGSGETGRLVFARIDPHPSLRPGDFVTVTITEPALSGVARLPASALAADDTVLVVGPDDRLMTSPVELVRRQGDDVILRGEGLAGQLVVAVRSPLIGTGIRVRPSLPDTAGQSEATLVPLAPERRARLIAAVESSQRIPEEAKARILSQLAEPMVPADVIERIERGMGS